ncbi:MAG TPA: tetratricopeptide repeat protein [Polyangiales bacterium]|jgi:hypothetical protein|nr:tetratricopeptide repeat protein [Polyangiales bacterium]
MARVLYALQSMFSLWMMVDAMQRGAARYWYPMVWLPGGPLVYFFMVKIHDREFRGILKLWEKLTKPKVTLEQLRFQAVETPSFGNKLLLAQGLFDAQLYSEAAPVFAGLLAEDDEHKGALYGLALCRIELKEYEPAIEALRLLVEIKPSFHDYDGWARLAYALRQSDQFDAALEVLATLVRKAPRVPHRVLYARYLREAQQLEEARKQIELALQAHKYAPRFQKRQDAAAARAGKAMLDELVRE